MRRTRPGRSGGSRASSCETNSADGRIGCEERAERVRLGLDRNAVPRREPGTEPAGARAHGALARLLWGGPSPARDQVPGGEVGRVGPAVLPMPTGRSGHEIGMRADEPPNEPAERTAERSADALPDVFE